MIGIIDAVMSLGGLVIPPVFDFIKKKFIPDSDTPEATLSTLATTKPDVIEGYVEAQAKLLEAQAKYFNRDVIGRISLWVRNLRASIRPVFVVFGIMFLYFSCYFGWEIPMFFKYIMETAICSWFGCRLIT